MKIMFVAIALGVRFPPFAHNVRGGRPSCVPTWPCSKQTVPSSMMLKPAQSRAFSHRSPLHSSTMCQPRSSFRRNAHRVSLPQGFAAVGGLPACGGEVAGRVGGADAETAQRARRKSVC